MQLRFAILWAIRMYQKTASPDHGLFRALYPRGFCKFHPSCSMYAYDAISRYGIIRGASLSIWRVLRCNPWTKGGNDPVK